MRLWQLGAASSVKMAAARSTAKDRACCIPHPLSAGRPERDPDGGVSSYGTWAGQRNWRTVARWAVSSIGFMLVEPLGIHGSVRRCVKSNFWSNSWVCKQSMDRFSQFLILLYFLCCWISIFGTFSFNFRPNFVRFSFTNSNFGLYFSSEIFRIFSEIPKFAHFVLGR